jgi:hypothetical protein
VVVDGGSVVVVAGAEVVVAGGMVEVVDEGTVVVVGPAVVVEPEPSSAGEHAARAKARIATSGTRFRAFIWPGYRQPCPDPEQVTRLSV